MEHYFHQSIAPATHRSYNSAQTRYITFCTQFNIQPLPLEETHLCRFASFLANDNITHTTIKCYFSALRRLQLSHHYPDPLISSFPKLECVVKGIKREQAHKQGGSPKRLPITIEILQKLRVFFEARSHEADAFMLWAAVTTCFFGFMRSGEMTLPSETSFDPSSHLTFGDVTVDDISTPQIVKLRLKASKTDPFRKGVEIVLGRTNNSLCPVAALLSYLAKRGNKPGFLFLFVDDRPLTKSRFILKIREALSHLGIDSSQYAGHSFRIGAATTAAAQGIPDSVIQMLGRWRSSAYQLYIRTPKDKLARYSSIIAA